MEVTVTSNAALATALASAQSGDTIYLAAGSYSTIGVKGVSFSGAGVTIASADPRNPATVAGVEVSSASGLTFRDLDISVNSRLQTAFQVGDSSNIKLDGLNVHDVPGGNLGGLFIRNSSNVTVTDSDFHDLGTAARSMNSNFVTMTGNRFTDIRGDGIQSTSTSNITLEANHFTNFHTAPGDHPDAIQFFTYNQTASVENIVITGNILVRGSGDVVQGIFMGNEASLAYINVTISGNKIIGGMYNGIAIGNVKNLVLTNNVVQAYADMDSWIRVEGASNALISNNQASALFTDKDNMGLSLLGNTKLTAVAIGDTALARSIEASGLVRGTADADTLTGGAGDDQLYGGAGNDSVVGGSGVNLLRGEDGNDTLVGGNDFDDMHGNAGNDVLYGGGGNDWVVGGQGDDKLFGQAGGDIVYGNLGDDTCDGGDGADTVTGGQGNDVLYGGAGDDYLSGDKGSDTMTGGTGADVFHTFAGTGYDLITDFNATEGDRVMIDAGTRYAVAQSGGDTVITMEGGGQLVLAGVNMGSLHAGWIFGA